MTMVWEEIEGGSESQFESPSSELQGNKREKITFFSSGCGLSRDIWLAFVGKQDAELEGPLV